MEDNSFASTSLDSNTKLTKIAQLQELSRKNRNQDITAKDATSLLSDCDWDVSIALNRLLDGDKKPPAKEKPSSKRSRLESSSSERRVTSSSRARSRRCGLEEGIGDDPLAQPRTGHSVASLLQSTDLGQDSKKKKKKSSKRKRSNRKPKSSRHDKEEDANKDSSVTAEVDNKAESRQKDTPVPTSSNLERNESESGAANEIDQKDEKEVFLFDKDYASELMDAEKETTATVTASSATDRGIPPPTTAGSGATHRGIRVPPVRRLPQPGAEAVGGSDPTDEDDDYTLTPLPDETENPDSSNPTDAIVTAQLVEHDEEYYEQLRQQNEELQNALSLLNNAPVAVEVIPDDDGAQNDAGDNEEAGDTTNRSNFFMSDKYTCNKRRKWTVVGVVGFLVAIGVALGVSLPIAPPDTPESLSPTLAPETFRPTESPMQPPASAPTNSPPSSRPMEFPTFHQHSAVDVVPGTRRQTTGNFAPPTP